MPELTIYHFDQATGQFLGTGTADENPLDRDNPLIPAGATTIAPPNERAGFVRIFSAGEWGYLAETGEKTEPTPEPVYTADMVVQERTRRLALGFDYDFGDARGKHHIGTSEQDLKNWDEVTQLASAAINLGQGDSKTISIITETGGCTVTANEWQHVLIAAGDARQPIFQASFSLQAMDPIPSDYADDSRWP